MRYSARFLGSNGDVGTFRSASEAQRAIERSFGRRNIVWRTEVTGGVERVIGRDSLFTLDDLDDLLAWWEGDTGVHTLGTTDDVTRWGDRSGQGNRATQTTAANRPVRVASAHAGQPAVSFTPGSEKFLVSSLSLPTQFTMIIVAQAISAITAEDMLLVRADTSPVVVRVGKFAGSQELFVQNAGFGATTLGPIDASRAQSIIYRQASTGAQFWLDGSQVATNGGVLTAASTEVRISTDTLVGGQGWQSNIQRVAIVGRPLSDREVERVNSDIDRIWGIPP